MTLSDAWEERAQAWIEWARRPDHDGFWTGTWPELRTILPSHPCSIVELGCGEGRVGRELLQLGHRVVGVEQAPTLARAAGQHETPVAVLQADAARLPLAGCSVDVAVACMSLHDVDDLRATLDEVWRVLRGDGFLCVSLVHPFATAQDPDSMHSEPPTFSASYLVERRFEDHVDRDGLEMTFVSVHRPMSAYVTAFVEAGFVLEVMREFGTKPIPWLLTMRLRKVPRG